MDTRLIVLKLYLDELGVPTDITTVADRKRLQKAVYLGQLFGVGLSYHYSWYLKGPYSTALTRDYYDLAEALASGDRDFEGKSLHESVKERIEKTKPLMEVPQDVDLRPEDWLELISSLHYLLRVRSNDKEKAVEVLKKEKPHVAPFIGRAEDKLREAKLLQEEPVLS